MGANDGHYRRHLKQLESYHMRSTRSILNIRWQDKLTNVEVLDLAGSIIIEAMILKTKVGWTRHSYG